MGRRDDVGGHGRDDGGGAYHVDAPVDTYVEEGTYTVTVTVKHDALAALTSNAQTIVVADQQITSLVGANLPASGLEGAAIGAIASLATFTDPAGVGNETAADFTATVNWGDGTTSAGTVVSLGGGNYRRGCPEPYLCRGRDLYGEGDAAARRAAGLDDAMPVRS